MKLFLFSHFPVCRRLYCFDFVREIESTAMRFDFRDQINQTSLLLMTWEYSKVLAQIWFRPMRSHYFHTGSFRSVLDEFFALSLTNSKKIDEKNLKQFV